MFDFSKLTPRVADRQSSRYSFVGIKKGPSESVELWLPHGFHDFPKTDEGFFFVELKRLFFGLYKSIRRYCADSRASKASVRTSDRDGCATQVCGSDFRHDEDSVTLYGKLSCLDAIFDCVDGLYVGAIIEKIFSQEKVNWSRIDQYLHRGVYLEDNLVFVDEMDLVSPRIESLQTELVALFCYIYCEIKVETLEVDDLPSEIKILHEHFKHRHLSGYDELFCEHHFGEMMNVLRRVFYDITMNTHYKDEQFIIIGGAVENFLFGGLDDCNSGIVWGVDNFWPIWERMCHSYSRINFGRHAIFADDYMRSNGRIGGHDVFVDRERLNYCFDLQVKSSITSNFVSRHLRPDLVSLFDSREETIRCEVFPSSRGDSFVNVVLPKTGDSSMKIFFKELMKSKGTCTFNDGTFYDYPNMLFQTIRKRVYNTCKKTIAIEIYDFKYLDVTFFLTGDPPSKKMRRDAMALLAYRMALAAVLPTYYIFSMSFIIPKYFVSNESLIPIGKGAAPFLQGLGIKVYQLNFMEAMRVYNEFG